MNRTELREKAMIILYQINVYSKNKIAYNTDDVILEVAESKYDFIQEIVYGVTTYLNEINEVCNKYLIDWTIDRLGFTDQAILRIGVYELLYSETPDIVAINEAVELSKKYSDDEVRKMINSVLDKIYKNK